MERIELGGSTLSGNTDPNTHIIMKAFRSQITRRRLLWLSALLSPSRSLHGWSFARGSMASSINIDIYTHFFPPAYAREISRTATQSHPDVPNIEMLMRLFPNLSELDMRLAHMDRFRTSLQILTPLPIPPDLFVSSPQAAARLTQV